MFERESIFHVGFWVGNLIPQALRDRCETESKTQRQVLRRGTETTTFFQVPREKRARDESAFKHWETGARSAESTYRVKLDHHNLQVSISRYIEKVFMDVRQKLNRPDVDQIVLDQRVHVLIWGFFMSTTMKAATHLAENYSENLSGYKNTNFDAEVDLGSETRDSECLHDWMVTFSFDEIYVAT